MQLINFVINQVQAITMQIESALSDTSIIISSVLGIAIILLIPYILFHVNKLKDKIGGNDDGIAILNKRKSKIPEKRKEEIKLLRQKAKEMLQDYKESCRKSQLNNKKEPVELKNVTIVTVDNIIDYISEQKRVSFINIVYKGSYIYNGLGGLFERLRNKVRNEIGRLEKCTCQLNKV